MLSVLTSYLPWLALTIVIEVLVAWLFAPRAQRKQVLTACVVMQVFTHPLACAAVYYAEAPVSPVEVVVIVVEVLLYCALTKFTLRRAIGLAWVANVVSFVVGEVMGIILFQ